MGAREILLFVCDSLLSGEHAHALLAEAEPRGATTTEARYHLIDFGATGALLEGGPHAVPGELYAIEPRSLAAIDIARGHPVVHQRARVTLVEGGEADAYFVTEDQARGARRVREGSWKKRRGAPNASSSLEPGTLVRWARRRFDR